MHDVSSKPSLRPWPGRKLPDELRPENVDRLSEALAKGGRDAEFERLVHRIDSGPNEGNADVISKTTRRVAVRVIRTDEEMVFARAVRKYLETT